MNEFDHRQRYLQQMRHQLRRELDEMGYRRQAPQITVRQRGAGNSAGLIAVSAGIVALMLGLTLPRLLS